MEDYPNDEKVWQQQKHEFNFGPISEQVHTWFWSGLHID